MQLLQEVSSPDHIATAKIYDDSGTFFVEYWVNGNLQRTFNSSQSLEEIVYFANQWVGSVQTLNG